MVGVALIGFGNMGWKVLQILHNKHADIIAVFNRKSHVGQDAGQVAGIGNIGIVVSPMTELEEIFARKKPDICLIQSVSDIPTLKPSLEICAKCGVNVLTLAESIYYPWHEFPKEAEELDKLFKDGGCTLTAGGYQDGFWSDLIITLAASANNIRGISAKVLSNLHNFFGGASLEAKQKFEHDILGIGLTPEEFEVKIARPIQEKENDQIPGGFCGNAVHRLVDSFGWTIKKVSTSYTPILGSKDEDAGYATIPAGNAIGMNAHIYITTHQGFYVDFLTGIKLMAEGVGDTNEWTVHADPDVHMSTYPANINMFTNTSYVNRIPDVIKAPSGLITTSMMAPPKYVHSLQGDQL